jgi:hypothetical protein
MKRPLYMLPFFRHSFNLIHITSIIIFYSIIFICFFYVIEQLSKDHDIFDIINFILSNIGMFFLPLMLIILILIYYYFIGRSYWLYLAFKSVVFFPLYFLVFGLQSNINFKIFGKYVGFSKEIEYGKWVYILVPNEEGILNRYKSYEYDLRHYFYSWRLARIFGYKFASIENTENESMFLTKAILEVSFEMIPIAVILCFIVYYWNKDKEKSVQMFSSVIYINSSFIRNQNQIIVVYFLGLAIFLICLLYNIFYFLA